MESVSLQKIGYTSAIQVNLIALGLYYHCNIYTIPYRKTKLKTYSYND